MWIALFIFCNAYEGCMAVTFEDQKKYETKEICTAYTEEKSELVIETLRKYNVPGSIHYDCKQDGETWS